ncbi:unnamed protein product [Mycena citricolor]|uniref:Uncharacterized protein n=1 Tax=Mycena citricolor TaxID=2018698 RepID=A0AAD2H2F5_9AGAR|nr:unnamed protein product [Mycena citricolor]
MTLILLQQYAQESLGDDYVHRERLLVEGQEVSPGVFEFGRTDSDVRMRMERSTLLNPDLDLRRWYRDHWDGSSELYDDLPPLESSNESDDELEEGADDPYNASWQAWVNTTSDCGLQPDLSPSPIGSMGDLCYEMSEETVRPGSDQWDLCSDEPQHGKSCGRQVGDLMADGVRSLLEFCQPYPGDDRIRPDAPCWTGKRFSVVSSWCEEGYYVRDRVNRLSTYLPSSMLENRHFELAAWYSGRVSERLLIPSEGTAPGHRIAVDDLLGIQLSFYMDEMVALDPVAYGSFVNIEPQPTEDRIDGSNVPMLYAFEMDRGGGVLTRVDVPRKKLLNPRLDLANLLARRRQKLDQAHRRALTYPMKA